MLIVVRGLRLPALVVIGLAPAFACSILTGVSQLEEVPCEGGASCAPKGPDDAAPPDAAHDAKGDHAVESSAHDSMPEPIVCGAGLTACGDACANLANDSTNCGACAHDCLGGACTSGTCQPVQVADLTSFPSPLAIAVSKTTAFFTTAQGLIGSVPTGGGAVTMLVSGSGLPRHVAVNATNIYWVDDSLGKLMTCAIDGSNLTTLAAGLPFPWDLSLDATNAYFTARYDFDGGTTGYVEQCAIGGCAGKPTVFDSFSGASGGVRVLGSTLVWVEEDGFVESCPTSGCGPTGPVLLASGVAQPQSAAENGSSVFWVDQASGQIQGCPAPCATPTLVYTLASSSLDGQYSNPLAADSENVYFPDENGQIDACPVGGCGLHAPTVLASGQGDVYGIAVDNVAVYWTDFTADALMKVAK
jgi:hypothetical protein